MAAEVSEMTQLTTSLGLPAFQHYRATESSQGVEPSAPVGATVSIKRSYLVVGVLCYINLVNSMEWFIIAGILTDIQRYFGVRDSTTGLLQTVFIACFLLSAPLFGYLGDRHSRKAIMGAGVVLWSSVALGSSFITEGYYWLFLLARGLVGVGEASHSTVAPTIIADLFVKDRRSWMLGVFYIFSPVGSGLGYIIGSTMAEFTGHWQWALRVTPCLAAAGLLLLILSVPDPPRGAAEDHNIQTMARTTWCEDVKHLLKNRSFVWSSLGVTAMVFVIGALGFWAPEFLSRARAVHGSVFCTQEPCSTSDSLIFGIITVVTGILGVIIGAEIARRYRKINPRGDAIISAVGMFISSPCLYLAIVLAQQSILAAYVFIALGELFLSFNWAIVTDILLYVVLPTRRASAAALQITVIHLLGDAVSPYLVGAISDVIQDSKGDLDLREFQSLQYSFMVCPFVGVLGGGAFLMTALYIEEDRKKAKQRVEGIENKAFVPHEESLQGDLSRE
ncbi:protein spinster homolog 3 [Rhinatrema bivittatum]|uniref:protein spinster homolog 3 n=1 Tax=Rhinatrema bivittatum TaxID=194408 RepID=UPI00112832E1|nr:protein spinster homolog 3 [Rhinatrema bivittatum]